MSQTKPAPTPASHPTLGLVAQILGVVGAIICVLAIVGVLFGRGFVQDRIDVLAKGAVKSLDQAVAVSDQALTGLAAGSQGAAEVKAAAETLAASPTIDEAAFTALQDRLAPLSQKYTDLRDRYVVLREKATGFMDTARRLDRLIPGVEIPQGPVDLVAGMDQKLTALDQAITDLSAKATIRSAASETAAAIAVSAGRLEEGIGAATQLTQDIQDGLVGVQGEVGGFADRVSSLLGISSIAVAALFLWFALLHGALWALGRRWRAA